MTKTLLKTMPYAQATIISTEDTLILRSYSTDVIIISDGWMTCTGIYSQTTRKHISAFMREHNLVIIFLQKNFIQIISK